MAKCAECRSGDTHPLCGDNVCCITCGHTGPAAPSPTPKPARAGAENAAKAPAAPAEGEDTEDA